MNIPFLPPEASELAGQVDTLYFILIGLTLLFLVPIGFLLIYFAFRYRRKSEDEVAPVEHGSNLLEITWTLIPLGMALVVFFLGARLYIAEARPPANAMDIYVVGKQWMWKFYHLEGQQEIGELHVPVGTPVRLTLASQDVIHSFFVPAFRIKADAVPGRYSTLWFTPTQPGTYDLYCSEYCGTNHSQMRGKVVVLAPGDYATWLSEGGTMSAASQGQKLFQQLGCNSCHRPDTLRRGPVLEGIYGQPVRLATGEVVIADDNYIRNSIINPTSQVVEGFQPIMPSFQGRVSEEDLVDLIAYLRSIGQNGTGSSAPPPAPNVVNPWEQPTATPARSQ